MIRGDFCPVGHFRDGHRGFLRNQIPDDAVVRRIQMLDKNVGHSAAGIQITNQIDAGLKAAGGCADRHDEKARGKFRYRFRLRQRCEPREAQSSWQAWLISLSHAPLVSGVGVCAYSRFLDSGVQSKEFMLPSKYLAQLRLNLHGVAGSFLKPRLRRRHWQTGACGSRSWWTRPQSAVKSMMNVMSGRSAAW